MSRHALEETVLHGDFIGDHIVGECELNSEELPNIDNESIVGARAVSQDGSATGINELQVVGTSVESMWVGMDSLPRR